MRARSSRLAACIGLLLAIMSLSATLRADDTDKKDNKSRGVKLETSEGSVEFKSATPNAEKLGLKVYPGATAKKGNGDNGADLALTSTLKGDMNGSIRLQVMKFTSGDPSASVIGFYEKELAKYGKVIECRGAVKTNFDQEKDKSILTCDEEAKNDPNSTVLKAGSEEDQHVVTIKVINNGTEFSILHLKLSKAEHETL